MTAWGNFLAGRPVVRADGTAVTDAAVIQMRPGKRRATARVGVAEGCR